MSKKWTEATAVAALRRVPRGVRVLRSSPYVDDLDPGNAGEVEFLSGVLGIKLLGAVDYLANKHGYIVRVLR